MTTLKLWDEELSPAISDLGDGDDITIELDVGALAVKSTSDPGCVSPTSEPPECNPVVVGALLRVSSSVRDPLISAL